MSVVKEWHTNGVLAIHYFYENNKFHGEFKSWYMNGRLRSHDIYKNGEKVTRYAMQYIDNPVMFALAVGVPMLPKESETS